MAEIERVTKACKYAIGNMIKRGSCSFTSTDEDGYRYAIGWAEVIESLDKIRELQSNICKYWNKEHKECSYSGVIKVEWEVCEWKKASEDDMSIWKYYPECKGMTDVDISGFHYCPYCGRKIKVVNNEDCN